MELHNTLTIPADVPENKQEIFAKNYSLITRDTGKLFIFSCDHKIERLNADFYGHTAHPQSLHPEHLFRIASQGNIGAFATHLGTIARYAKQYPTITYIAKINASSLTINHSQSNEKNHVLWNIADVLHLKNNSRITIPGITMTVSIGQPENLAQAAQIIYNAHKEGLVTVISIELNKQNQQCPELIAGATGIGLSLGADFIKIKTPTTTQALTAIQGLTIASAAAGNSKIICDGGEKVQQELYLQQLYEQIHHGHTSGTATGRNIFQLPLPEAIALTHAIATIIYDNADYETAVTVYHKKLEKKE